MTDKLSSLDDSYSTGDLSIYPDALDTRDTLWEVRNNAVTLLKQTLSYNGKIIIVEDATKFPPKGQLRIGPEPGSVGEYELVYYGKRTRDTFQDLKRAYAGSNAGVWKSGEAWVSNAVSAEHHNAVKDALINMEINCGLKNSPDEDSLNGILKRQEVRFLTPKPSFRAFPIKGAPPLNVRFQNFTTGHIARYLWDFGDGGTSLEKSPNHLYLAEGIYTVKLNVTTTTGGQGVVVKKDYVLVSLDEKEPFFYVESVSNPYSVETANRLHVSPKEFVFVDQTDGDIVQRNWVFGDGETFNQEDPDIHEISHIYQKPGEYIVTELIQFANGRLKKTELSEPVVVI